MSLRAPPARGAAGGLRATRTRCSSPCAGSSPSASCRSRRMACGTPVVASGRGGSGEYLEDGENCLLFDVEAGRRRLGSGRRAAGRRPGSARAARGRRPGHGRARSPRSGFNDAVLAALERASRRHGARLPARCSTRASARISASLGDVGQGARRGRLGAAAQPRRLGARPDALREPGDARARRRGRTSASPRETWVTRDICAREPWPFEDGAFDFVVCSHTLEDLRDPVWVCGELQRVARAGYIEVPSRLEEQSWNVQGPWVGWGHHHWLIDVGEARHLLRLQAAHPGRPARARRFPAGFAERLSRCRPGADALVGGHLRVPRAALLRARGAERLPDGLRREQPEAARRPAGLLSRMRAAARARSG